MPSITVKSEYPDGQVVLVQVRGGMTFPDALDELRVTAKAAFHDAIVETREWSEAEDVAAELGLDDEEPDGL